MLFWACLLRCINSFSERPDLSDFLGCSSLQLRCAVLCCSGPLPSICMLSRRLYIYCVFVSSDARQIALCGQFLTRKGCTASFNANTIKTTLWTRRCWSRHSTTLTARCSRRGIIKAIETSIDVSSLISRERRKSTAETTPDTRKHIAHRQRYVRCGSRRGLMDAFKTQQREN